MDAVRSWLNGDRSYQVGVRLYQLYGSNQVLKDLFLSEHETPYKQKRLQDAMRELLHSKPQLDVEQPNDQNSSSELETKRLNLSWPPRPIGDPVVSALYEQWRPVYGEMMNLINRLFEIVNDGERGQAAHRILDLDDVVSSIYLKRDHYMIHGALPDDKPMEKVTDPIKWPLKLANAQRYVREYSLKCHRDPSDERLAAKLKHYQDVVTYYKKLLKV